MSGYIYDYMDAGFRIFPLWPITKDGCGCGDENCKAVGKHPRISNWQNVPMWSDDQLEVMEGMGQFETGFGVVVENALVIDIDPRNGGNESYKKLCKDLNIDFEKLSGFVVATGGGGKHIYFSLKPPMSLSTHHKNYKGIDFKNSGYMVGCGSLHRSGALYEKDKGNPCDLTDCQKELIDLLKKQDHFRVSLNGEALDITEQEIIDMLSYCDPDCTYDQWIKIGMSIHHSTSGDGFALWNAWSSKGEKYNGANTLDQHWHSFGKASNPVTIGTLMHFAEAGGYKRSVTFDITEEQQEELKQHKSTLENDPDSDPFVVDEIDILRPPGYLGKVTDWINSQCRFPREYLAVVAALQTIGNICGLRYTDDKDGVTTNLFSFGISASATGKEAIQTAMMELHRAAGITAAVHGQIKSEQEITRNLVRHQCAFYIADEVGIILQKISNAAKSGASYLEGVVGLLMSAYGKSNGYMLLSGDLKEDIRKDLQKEYAQCVGKIEENEDKDGFYQQRKIGIQETLDNLDDGLRNPYLSLIGFTTPVTFDGLVTYDMATNGFIGRSLLIREHETNPKERDNFKKPKLDAYFAASLKQLYQPGFASPDKPLRLEHKGDRIEIRTTCDAWELLKQVKKWIYNYAEFHKGATGFESVVRRGYEMCAKISLILACPEGVRTAEHIKYAYKLMRRDIDEKIQLAYRNQLEQSESKENRQEALSLRVIDVCANEKGETISTILQRATNKKYTKGDVTNALNHLIESGLIFEIEKKHAKTGAKILRYSSKKPTLEE